MNATMQLRDRTGSTQRQHSRRHEGAAGTRPNIALSRRHRSEARSVSEPMNTKYKLMQIIRSNRSAADSLFWAPFARGFCALVDSDQPRSRRKEI